MANEQNLIPNSERTPSERRENAKKAGKASGKARGRKANLRRAAKELLEGVYLDRNGEERTGEELVMLAVFANATEPGSRNWAAAVGTIMELMGEKQTPEQKKKLKAETDVLKAKAAILRGGDDSALNKLDEILKGLSDEAEAFGKTE